VSGVEEGEHKVIIAYRNYQGEQTVYFTGDVKEFDINITIQPKNLFLSPLVLSVIGFLALIIVVLGTMLVKAKRA